MSARDAVLSKHPTWLGARDGVLVTGQIVPPIRPAVRAHVTWVRASGRGGLRDGWWGSGLHQ